MAEAKAQEDSRHAATRVVRLHLRSLLREGRYADLNRGFEELQDAFEADPRCEYWPSDAADAFGIADLALDAPLDAWVAATPDAFAPYLARGSHRVRVGHEVNEMMRPYRIGPGQPG